MGNVDTTPFTEFPICTINMFSSHHHSFIILMEAQTLLRFGGRYETGGMRADWGRHCVTVEPPGGGVSSSLIIKSMTHIMIL